LIRIDSLHQKDYEANLKAFEMKIDDALFGAELVKVVGSKKLTRLSEQGNLFKYLDDKKLTSKLGGWLKKAQGLRGKQLVTYHRTWAYFAARFGFSVPIEIEDKPGIPSSAKHRDEVIKLMKQNKIDVILKELFYDRLPAEYIAKQTAAAIVEVPIDVGASKSTGHYVDLIEYILDQLIATKKF
jgi:ABC-type Zn uptake system ZnuABC Zn-binding protein ZnuA